MNIEDSAQAHEIQQWEIINRSRKVVVHQPGDADYGPVECEKCCAEMHPVRRGHGFRVCTPCASAAEARRR